MVTFHIGHHKTATTWLQEGVFKNHPDIHLQNDPKKPWNDQLLNSVIASSERSYNYSTAKALLDQSLTGREKSHCLLYSAERLSGHPFSGGIDSFRTAERLHKLCPSAKILIGVRAQSTMLKSVYVQLVKAGYCGSFTSLTTEKNWKVPSFQLDFFEYDKIIAHYISLFGRNNVQVLFYEDLLSDATSYLNTIAGFLNVDLYLPSNFIERKNSSANADLVKLSINNQLRSAMKSMSKLGVELDESFERNLRMLIEEKTANISVDSLMSSSLDIVERYEASNIRLFNLLGLEKKVEYF